VARAIGSPPRFVLVDTATERLWMIDGNRVAGRMKVVVGRDGMRTPDMAALIRFAVVNPFWDIPPDLVRNEVAPRVKAAGLSYLEAHQYEPVTSYEESGVTVDPGSVDWHAVQQGAVKIGLRQLPGPSNMMGRVMFMFPNKLGIYLHDTPARWVFSRSDRRMSHGCVRLEDAPALYQWLFGRTLAADQWSAPATREDLPEPVPLHIARFESGGLRL